MHQPLTVVIGLDPHPAREQVELADLLDLVMHAGKRLQRIAAVAHQHDPLHHVGIEVLADDSEPRRRSVGNVREFAYAHRNAVVLGDGDLLHVRDAVDEAEAADVERLLAQRESLSAHVLVGVRECRRELRQRRSVALEPVRIDVDVKLAGLAAESHHVDDAGDLPELPLQDPVLRRLQLGERVARTA